MPQNFHFPQYAPMLNKRNYGYRDINKAKKEENNCLESASILFTLQTEAFIYFTSSLIDVSIFFVYKHTTTIFHKYEEMDKPTSI